MPLRFLLFSWLILIRKMTSGGVLESSGSPLDDGHKNFQNWCRNGWDNWSWSWQPTFGKWQSCLIPSKGFSKNIAPSVYIHSTVWISKICNGVVAHGPHITRFRWLPISPLQFATVQNLDYLRDQQILTQTCERGWVVVWWCPALGHNTLASRFARHGV